MKEVTNKLNLEDVATESMRMKINQERSELVALKIKIQEILPEHMRFSEASMKFEMLELIDKGRDVKHKVVKA